VGTGDILIYDGGTYPVDKELVISLLSLAISVVAALYSRKKVLLEKLRYAEAKDRQLGRSISFDILHVAKAGRLMDSPDNPWDPYELKQIVAHITFTNNSACPVWLKALNVGIIAVSTLPYHSNLLMRMSAALYPVRWGLQMALPFRFSDYTRSTFITTFLAGKRLGTPTFSLRLPPELKAHISRSEKVIEGIIVTDEKDGKPVSTTDWVEVLPGDTKCWAVGLQITDLGATWFRRSRLKLSKLYVSLEFNTRSVDAHATIPPYYWKATGKNL
jgi:hypothetical protein